MSYSVNGISGNYLLRVMTQNTLHRLISFSGVGLHSGQTVNMIVKPAPVDTGIVFIRTDIADKNNKIQALWQNVVQSQLCTQIENEDGVRIGTLEHLMAALRGCGVDNVFVELDGPEVPIMDGSSEPFVDAIDAVGLKSQAKARRVIRILKTVTVEEDGKSVSLTPSQISEFSGIIDFNHPVIGKQEYRVSLLNGNFRHDVANCRTFGFLHEVQAMHEKGLALGGSLDNAIVLDHERVLNNSGLRRNDEFIRHKILDAIGDLFLAGFPIIGEYQGYKASHALNNKLLLALFADQSAWQFEEEDTHQSSQISNAGFCEATI